MNQHILITGASRGIGREIALTLSKEQNHLFLTGFHHPEQLESLKQEVEQNGSSCAIFCGDLSKPETVAELFSKLQKEFHGIDILINNAGISHVELFQDSSEENFQEILNTNLSSAVRITKEAVRMMLPQKSGRILNISSVFGSFGGSMEVEYSLTKGGLEAFTKALGKELAPSNIQVNALSLGAVETEMNQRLSDNEKAALREEIPMGRFAGPSEVGEMVSLLLKAPSYLTGSVIPFHGGWF